MKTLAVFLFILGLALARGDATSDKVNHLETKGIHQVIKPATLETASTRNGDMKIAHMQYQTNRMDNQELSYQHHSQMQNSQPHIQNEASRFYNENQASFHNRDQAEIAQFHHQSQGPSESPVHRHQEISSLLQSQQRMAPTSIASFQSKEQGHDLSSQQLYSDSIRPQQDSYEERRSMVDARDQASHNRFAESSNKQSPIISDFHSSEIRATSFPRVYHQHSSFHNREQAAVLPGVSQTHSTSVVVSGLKNLPVLPALVYSSGTVPSAHLVPYSRPWFQGYVKQHWQTPYARYVYSHIL